MSHVSSAFHPGELVVYRMQKYTSHPGPRAADVEPEQKGERYVYHVDKYWVVSAVAADGSVVVVTRTGKQRRVEPNDTRLRPARWWERWLLRSRFPTTTSPNDPVSSTSSASAQPHSN